MALSELLHRLTGVPRQLRQLGPSEENHDSNDDDDQVVYSEKIVENTAPSGALRDESYPTDVNGSPQDAPELKGPPVRCQCQRGVRRETVLALASAAGRCLLDVHSDCDHHRSVFTLADGDQAVEAAVRELARSAVSLLDLRRHSGAHPRIGVLDVVPWIALEGWPLTDAEGSAGDQRARTARDEFAAWASVELGLPVFLYGPERSLPELRGKAWSACNRTCPQVPHPTAGAVAVGCRPLMVAYNLWLANCDLAKAKAVAALLRSPVVRALAFALGDKVQVSCNLLRPLVVGPAQIGTQWR